MATRVALVVSVVMALGCKKGGASDAPTCGPAIEGLVARMHTNADGPELDEARSNYKAVLSNRCAEDRWSVEALACIQVAPSEDEFEKCRYKNLSQEQQDKLNRATQSISFGQKTEAQRAGSRQADEVAEAMAVMNGFTDRMCGCNDKACADTVQDEMNAWSAAMAKTAGSQARPDEATMKKMTEIGVRYGECMAKAMQSSPPPAVRPSARTATRLPRECDTYRVEIEKLARCQKLPPATRDALKQSYEQTSAAWASVPPEGRAALGSACKSAAAAVRASSAECNSDDLPRECRQYEAAILKLAECDKLPTATREALRQSYEQTAAAWSSVPPEGRAALSTACKSAADAVEQSAAACE